VFVFIPLLPHKSSKIASNSKFQYYRSTLQWLIAQSQLFFTIPILIAEYIQQRRLPPPPYEFQFLYMLTISQSSTRLPARPILNPRKARHPWLLETALLALLITAILIMVELARSSTVRVPIAEVSVSATDTDAGKLLAGDVILTNEDSL